MKFFSASFDTVLIRYYLLMVVGVVPFLIGVPALAFLALPVFLSAFMGIDFTPTIKKAKGLVFKIGDEEDSFSAKAA